MRASARPTEPGRSGTEASPADNRPKAVTVAEIVSRIRASVEGLFPAPLWIEGEVSNCSFPSSGHIYFSLVDEHATDRFSQRILLPCAFFRNANQHLQFKLEDGLKVLCFGEVTTYEARGQYQLRVLRLEPKGIGALQLAFEQLKRRLAAEGLFDEARKRPIPSVPERIGIVTSRTGSVIHDMLVRLRGRFHVILLPVRVQGEGAAAEIAEAIALANARRLADVLIVGRGGGGLEDLWAFNEESVARAIVGSRIPVISAVGHEDDWTIADHVADLRASTPTHAAQWFAHQHQTLQESVRTAGERLEETMCAVLEEQQTRLEHLRERLRLLHPVHQLREYLQRAAEASRHLVRAIQQAVGRAEQRLELAAGRLEALSPLAVLARGYSITFHLPGRRVVTDAGQVRPGDHLETRVARGRIASTVTQTDRTGALDGAE